MRGIHPPALADRGLAGGIEALALPIPLPVTVTVDAARSLPAAGRVGGVLRGRRVPGQHRQARRRDPGLGVGSAHDGEVLHLVVGDDGRGGADPAGSGLAGVAQRLAAFDGTMDGRQPGGRADRRDHGGAVPGPAPAEGRPRRGPGPAPGRADPDPRGQRHRGGRRRSTTRRRWTRALADATTSTSPSSTYGCRRRSPPRAWSPAIAARAARPGLPGAGAQPVRRAALRPRPAGQRRGRGRLPAQGPGRRRRRVRGRRTPGRRQAAPCSTPRWSPAW